MEFSKRLDEGRIGELLADVIVARGGASALCYRDLLQGFRTKPDARSVSVALIRSLYRRGEMDLMTEPLPAAFRHEAAKNRRGQWSLVAGTGSDVPSFADALHELRIRYSEVYSWAYRLGTEDDGVAAPEPESREDGQVAEVIEFPSPRM